MTARDCAATLETYIEYIQDIGYVPKELVIIPLLQEAAALLRASQTKANFKPWLETYNCSIYKDKLK